MIDKIVRWLNEHHLPVRLVIGVIAGIAFAMLASILTYLILHFCGIFPPIHHPKFDTEIVTIELIYHSIYAVIGAMITAHIAKDKAKKAVFVLGSKEAIMWLIGVVLLWKHTYAWYNLSKAALGIPLAVLGGYLYRRFIHKGKQSSSDKQAVKSKS